MQKVKPTPPKELFQGIAGLVIIVFIIYSTCNNKTEDRSDNPQMTIVEPANTPIYTLTAVELNRDYQANEVAADQKYKGQRMRVAGIVTNIAKDAFDKIYITLSTGELFQEMSCRGIPENIASQLYKGEKVLITGECQGLFMGSVSLNDCSKCEQLK